MLLPITVLDYMTLDGRQKHSSDTTQPRAASSEDMFTSRVASGNAGNIDDYVKQWRVGAPTGVPLCSTAACYGPNGS